MHDQLDPRFTSDRSAQHRKPTLCKGLYTGVVLGALPRNNLVQVKYDGLDFVQTCVWGCSIFSGLLGFKTSYIPPSGTKVIVFHTEQVPSFIVSAIPSIMVDPGQQDRHMTGPDSPSYHDDQAFASAGGKSTPMYAGHKPPVDLAEGEIQLDNLLGVGLSLLRGMASLQAGDRARIECHLMDDMVRVISDTFKHYTAFGDYVISNDGGKLNVAWHGTSYEHEAMGRIQARDPLVPTTDQDTVDMETDLDGTDDDGRWRFDQYIGWLGNFVHMFFTDPVNALGQLAESQIRPGKARLHVNGDGSILVQSIADIVLEKVVAIPVPIPIRREDDVNGNTSGQALQHQEYLKTWKPSNNANLFEMAFQLREYARWLNNSYSMSRFYQMDRDWRVPSEAEVPLPDVSGAEVDKRGQNSGIINWRVGYSTIRIYRDGSIQTVDAYGNSITTTKVGVQIASAGDLLLQAAGSVNIVAGRDVNILAQQNVGITAALQFVRIKASLGIQALTTLGNMVFETLGSFAVKFKCLVNFNNLASVDMLGNIDSMGEIVASLVASESSLPGDSIITHSGHLFIGSPVVEEIDDEFSFQDEYGAGDLYETITQQMLKSGDVISSGTWIFSANAVPGKGSPWPGPSPMQKSTAAGSSLNKPSGQLIFTSAPAPLSSSSTTMRTHS